VIDTRTSTLMNGYYEKEYLIIYFVYGSWIHVIQLCEYATIYSQSFFMFFFE